jgi:hypothetical protein
MEDAEPGVERRGRYQRQRVCGRRARRVASARRGRRAGAYFPSTSTSLNAVSALDLLLDFHHFPRAGRSSGLSAEMQRPKAV